MRQVKIWSLMVVGAILGILVLQNTEPVQTEILFTTIVLPRAVLIAVVGVLGFISGIITCWLVRKPTDK